MVKATRIIKLSKNIRPFISRVSKSKKAVAARQRLAAATRSCPHSKQDIKSGATGRCVGGKLRGGA